ncbi:hypothetical protein MRX96_035950 [Rhipicephalus microplus]
MQECGDHGWARVTGIRTSSPREVIRPFLRLRAINVARVGGAIPAVAGHIRTTIRRNCIPGFEPTATSILGDEYCTSSLA